MDKELEMANFLNNPDNWKVCKEIGNFLTMYEGTLYACAMMADGTFDKDDDGKINFSEVEESYKEDSTIRWNALCENEPQPEAQLKALVLKLGATVQEMSDLYDKVPSLNDTISLGKIIPMSLDEWAFAIDLWIEKQDQMKTESEDN